MLFTSDIATWEETGLATSADDTVVTAVVYYQSFHVETSKTVKICDGEWSYKYQNTLVSKIKEELSYLSKLQSSLIKNMVYRSDAYI